MNYRHAFHAGGFADVIKHIVLVRILSHLQEKPAAFRVIETHAGAGIYDLTGDEARRSGEWLTGIARLMQARLSDKTQPLIGPYLDIVRAFNPQAALAAYPSSPATSRASPRALNPPENAFGSNSASPRNRRVVRWPRPASSSSTRRGRWLRS